MADDMGVESWQRILAKWGATAAIAFWLVYQLTTDQKELMRETRSDVASIKASVTAHSEQMAPLMANMQALVNLALQDCVNRADDYVKRDRCFRAQYEKPSR